MHAEDVLEFEDLRSLLARYLRGALGRAELARLRPCSDAALIQSALDDTAEAMEYLRAAGHPQPAARGAAIRIRFDDLPDPAPAIARLRIEGATLDAPEILNLSRLLDLAGEARSVLLAARGRFPRLGRLASAIADLREVAANCVEKSCPTARSPTRPAPRWPACGATSRGSGIRSRSPSNGSCALVTKTARFRKTS